MSSPLIGTSGWHYNHWKGVYYPTGIPASEWLAYYSSTFSTVEINNSFYRLPSENTFRTWRDTVPPGFTFAVKGSRFITHMKKLSDPETSVVAFFERVALLGEKLGPILFQLPPRWRVNQERLERFLAALPPGCRYAFEFREPGWLIEPVFRVLAKFGAALCIYDFNRRTSPKEVTADFVYVRLHGLGGPYQGRYSLEELRVWANDCRRWADMGISVYVYFDNDMAGFAVQNAQELKQLVS